MPRRDREYDDDEPSPPPTKGGFPLWLILVLGGVGVCVLMCGGVGALAYVMYKRDVVRREVLVEREMMMAEREHAEAEARRDEMRRELWPDRALDDRFSREEFRTSVAGRTEAEVETAVGKPDSTEERGGDLCWVYKHRIQRGDNSPEREVRAVVTFRNGRVAEVAFE